LEHILSVVYAILPLCFGKAADIKMAGVGGCVRGLLVSRYDSDYIDLVNMMMCGFDNSRDEKRWRPMEPIPSAVLNQTIEER